MSRLDDDRSEKLRKMATYLCSFAIKAEEMLNGDEIDHMDEEIACAAVDLLWLAEGRDVPDSFYSPEHRAYLLYADDDEPDGGLAGFKLV